MIVTIYNNILKRDLISFFPQLSINKK